MLQHPDVQGGRAPDAIAVQDLDHSPEAHPIAVFMEGVLLHIGQGAAGPGITHTVEGREVFIMLDVGGDPKGDPGIVRPLDDGTVDHREVIHAIRG
jgi:hypothetical protein